MINAIGDKVRSKHVLITGGLGMIGSTIARRLVAAGADVTLVDAIIEGYGANLFNIEDIKSKISLKQADIRDRAAMGELVRGQDIIINLAGQVSHNDSMDNPWLDAEVNYLGHLNLLEGLRRNNPQAVILYSGSRLQYGKIEYNPVDEQHPLRPMTPYALNKTAAENSYLYYHQIHGVRCVCFRIANPYGPRSQMRHSKYSMVNWFIRQAMEGKTLKVFGDGHQVRDYIYVDDLADAFIAAAVTDACHGEVFNLGSGVGTSFREMVETVVREVGSGQAEQVPWPENYINVETGDYISDISKLCRALQWRPGIPLSEGVRRTVEFYKQYRGHYWG